MKALIVLVLLFSSFSQAKTTAEIAQYVTDNVVMVTNFDETAGGTGFYVQTPRGVFVLTNKHVCDIKNKDGLLLIHESNGTFVTAPEIKSSEDPDLCLIKASNRQGLSLASTVYFRELGVMIGYPLLGPLVGNIGRVCDHMYLNKVIPGNSGSPIMDKDGDVIGVIHARELHIPIGYLITLDEIKKFLEGK